MGLPNMGDKNKGRKSRDTVPSNFIRNCAVEICQIFVPSKRLHN